MSKRFEKLPGKSVGLMLPASVASDIMLLGLYIANKTPVLLNWTTGPSNLAYATKLSGITHVVTSRVLRDRLNISIEGASYVDVEDLKKDVGWLEGLFTLLKVRWLGNSIRRSLPVDSPDSVCVILFTSGSEKRPKGVPLTHRNVMSNLRALPAILSLSNHDAILGFLPMFHSFGFTMTGLYPLLGGIRVVHHADPTDVAGVNRKIAAYKTSVLAGMPSLISHLIDRAQPGELDSLRFIAIGAEKCPLSLFQHAQVKIPQATLLEGYGITECSPAVSANRVGETRWGTIGKPLPGVEVCVVDLETQKVLPPGKMGMLQVHGPSVFGGYLGDEASPFVEHDGKRWYVTGDLAQFDDDGFIHFCGRLKRFVKSGGEMISLPALEEPLAARFPPDQEGPQLAVEGIELDNGRQIVLFARPEIELHDANEIIAQAGYRGVMRLDEVRHIDRLPLLGNGKIDYKILRSMIAG
jgi:long-chain-fatty-acid--[acyl-carrier-protein] ligase